MNCLPLWNPSNLGIRIVASPNKIPGIETSPNIAASTLTSVFVSIPPPPTLPNRVFVPTTCCWITVTAPAESLLRKKLWGYSINPSFFRCFHDVNISIVRLRKFFISNPYSSNSIGLTLKNSKLSRWGTSELSLQRRCSMKRPKGSVSPLWQVLPCFDIRVEHK